MTVSFTTTVRRYTNWWQFEYRTDARVRNLSGDSSYVSLFNTSLFHILRTITLHFHKSPHLDVSLLHYFRYESLKLRIYYVKVVKGIIYLFTSLTQSIHRPLQTHPKYFNQRPRSQCVQDDKNTTHAAVRESHVTRAYRSSCVVFGQFRRCTNVLLAISIVLHSLFVCKHSEDISWSTDEPLKTERFMWFIYPFVRMICLPIAYVLHRLRTYTWETKRLIPVPPKLPTKNFASRCLGENIFSNQLLSYLVTNWWYFSWCCLRPEHQAHESYVV